MENKKIIRLSDDQKRRAERVLAQADRNRDEIRFRFKVIEQQKLSQKDYRMHAVIGVMDSLTRDFEKMYAALFAVFSFGFSLYFFSL